MEFFIPGLAALLVTIALIFLVLPRLGAPLIALISIALLMFAIYQHYQLFQPEYRYATWMDTLKVYGPYVIIFFIIVSSLLYLGLNVGGGKTNSNSMSPINSLINTVTPMPSAESATNPLTSAVNNTLRAANNILSMGNNGRKNNSILSNLIATPRNNSV